MVVSIFLVIPSDPVAQVFYFIWCVVVAQMIRVWSMEPQHPGFRNPARLMRAITLPVGALHISTDSTGLSYIVLLPLGMYVALHHS